jgi:hypothetical protein
MQLLSHMHTKYVNVSTAETTEQNLTCEVHIHSVSQTIPQFLWNRRDYWRVVIGPLLDPKTVQFNISLLPCGMGRSVV